MIKYISFIKQRSNGAKLIWATITPITSKTRPIELNKNYNPIIEERNSIAQRVMKNNEIAINDLYSICLSDMEAAAGDMFHWNKEMYKRLGQQVAKKINSELKSKNELKEHKGHKNTCR